MAENKDFKPPEEAQQKPSRHAKKAEERRLRQAEALRANLKRRKTQLRERDSDKPPDPK